MEAVSAVMRPPHQTPWDHDCPPLRPAIPRQLSEHRPYQPSRPKMTTVRSRSRLNIHGPQTIIAVDHGYATAPGLPTKLTDITRYELYDSPKTSAAARQKPINGRRMSRSQLTPGLSRSPGQRIRGSYAVPRYRPQLTLTDDFRCTPLYQLCDNRRYQLQDVGGTPHRIVMPPDPVSPRLSRLNEIEATTRHSLQPTIPRRPKNEMPYEIPQSSLAQLARSHPRLQGENVSKDGRDQTAESETKDIQEQMFADECQHTQATSPPSHRPLTQPPPLATDSFPKQPSAAGGHVQRARSLESDYSSINSDQALECDIIDLYSDSYTDDRTNDGLWTEVEQLLQSPADAHLVDKSVSSSPTRVPYVTLDDMPVHIRDIVMQAKEMPTLQRQVSQVFSLGALELHPDISQVVRSLRDGSSLDGFVLERIHSCASSRR